MTTRVVAVLAGGVSPERDISLLTAAAVLEHLPRDRFRGVRVEVGTDGRWAVDGGAPTLPERAALDLRARGVDVVFPGLHGRYGEDGTVQGFLEVVGLPFVGSGVRASAIAMDKIATREILRRWGMPLPESVEVGHGTNAGEIADRLASLGLPAVVKDPTGGSSLDLRLATTAAERDDAIAGLLSRPGGRALVEAFVAGIEMTGPAIGNASEGGPLRALPPILIRPLRSTWFDYATKYDPAAVEELVPAPVGDAIVARVREQSLLAHRVLGCDGLTRSDFIVPADGVPRFLETNTLPGLTPASLCPKSAAADGIGFGELVAELVELALQKRGRLRK